MRALPREVAGCLAGKAGDDERGKSYGSYRVAPCIDSYVPWRGFAKPQPLALSRPSPCARAFLQITDVSTKKTIFSLTSKYSLDMI